MVSRSPPGLGRELPAEPGRVEPRGQQDGEASHRGRGRPRGIGRARDVSHERLAAQEHDELVQVEEGEASATDVLDFEARLLQDRAQRRGPEVPAMTDEPVERRAGPPGTVTTRSPPGAMQRVAVLSSRTGSSTCSSTSLHTATSAHPSISAGTSVAVSRSIWKKRAEGTFSRAPDALGAELETGELGGRPAVAEGREEVTLSTPDVEDAPRDARRSTNAEMSLRRYSCAGLSLAESAYSDQCDSQSSTDDAVPFAGSSRRSAASARFATT